MKRITTKTKKILRELSKRYSAITNRPPSDHNEPSQPSTFRSQLKRRLSSVSIRRHNSGPKWKWSKRFTESNQLNPDFETDPKFAQLTQSLENDTPVGNQKQVSNLSELFQSADFATRLSLGSVSGRKSYPEENEFETDYHISYRDSNAEYITNENQNSGEGFSNDTQFLKLQETFSYLKDQTIKRTKSLQSFAKFFGQEA